MEDRIGDLRRRTMPWKSSRTNTDSDTCEDQDQDRGSGIGESLVFFLFLSIFDFRGLQACAVQCGMWCGVVVCEVRPNSRSHDVLGSSRRRGLDRF